LTHLAQVHIVDVIGIGRYVSYQFNPRHPLGPVIAALFQAERNRVDAIYDLVRKSAQTLDPAPLAVWLFGSGARDDDTSESDLDIAIVGHDEQIHRQVDVMLDALLTEEDRLAFRPSVISLTKDDVDRMKQDNTAFWQNIARDAIPLIGNAPEQVARG
jgi:predicted nucleotidyltransferase